jgi:hypothetical protein
MRLVDIYTCLSSHAYTAVSIKAVHEQSGKVEYERERLLHGNPATLSQNYWKFIFNSAAFSSTSRLKSQTFNLMEEYSRIWAM